MKTKATNWYAWRQGYMGVWSIAHLCATAGKTICGIDIADNAEPAAATMTHCRKCASVEQQAAPNDLALLAVKTQLEISELQEERA